MKIDRKKIFIILVSALATAGCVPVAKKFAIEFKDPSAFKNLKLDVSSVQVQNNQLIVRGSGLKDIKTIKLVNNGVTETLVVESATSGQLVANGLSAVAIGVGKVFDMVLADAYGSATVPVTFTLENGSITIAHLSDMGAAPGQVLKYNGTVWEPSTLASSQIYQGVWNANTNTPNLNLTSPVSGEYYIVSVAGTYNTVAFDVGDWIIHNGTGWDKVVSSAANKLSLSGGTLTGNLQLDTLLKFKGAANYVTLKASATLATDIILTLPKTVGTSGQFLTTDGAGVMSWATPVDPVIDDLDASQIANGSVSNAAFQYLAGATSNIQAQLNAKQATGNFVTALTGDVTASGAGSVAATVATVGGATAANIAAATALANAATDANTASAIIKRDASGNFSAGTITGIFNGNATNVSGTVAVANGGTGNTTLGVNQLLFGNGTSAISGLPITGIPAVLLSTVASGAPAWTTSTTGNVLKGSVSGVGFGALTLSDLPVGTLSGAGTTNYIPYYNTTSTFANSPMAISGSNVGVGTTVPGSALEVWSSSAATGMTSVSTAALGTGSGGGIGLRTSAFPTAVDQRLGGFFFGATDGAATPTTLTGAGVFGWSAQAFSTGNAGSYLTFETAPVGSSIRQQRMRISSDGNIGIGTSTPTSTLEVNAPGAAFGVNQLKVTDGTTGGYFSVSEGASGAANYLPTFSFSSAGVSGIGGALLGIIPSANDGLSPSGAAVILDGRTNVGAVAVANILNVRNNGTPLMTMTASGNMGIGTTTPGDKLDVLGGAMRVSRNTSQYVYLSGGDVTNQHNYLRGMSTEGNKKIMYFQSFNDASGSAAGNNGFQFQTGTIASPLNAMSILESGKVGIGTLTPNSALQVNGTITGKASVLNATGTIDFSTGNQQYTASSCGTFNLNNLKDGGSYAFAVQGSTAALCSFNAFSDVGVTALTVHMPTNHGLSTASTHTLYNYMVMGTHVYVSWVPGY